MQYQNETAARATHATLRIGAGLLFMFHGAQKLLGWFGGVDQAGTSVPLISQMGLAGVLELFGGVLIVIGLFVRPVALLLVIEMLVAYFQVHLPQGIVPIQNGGELALLYGVIFLYFAGNGAGAVSLDAIRTRPDRTEAPMTPADEERLDLRRRRAS